MTKDCAAIFDLGGVVIDWNPRYLYRKLFKPDRRIFEIFLDTFRIEPSRAIYIDDTSENVEMAVQLGMRGVVFRDSAGLRRNLPRTGLLVEKIRGRLLKFSH